MGTYRFFPGSVLYPFGHGLSYTTFNYSDFTIMPLDGALSAANLTAFVEASEPTNRYSAPVVAVASVTVHNTGSVEADTTVLLYLVPPTAGLAGDPLTSLAGFARTSALAPG